jgi:hypothetical protein
MSDNQVVQWPREYSAAALLLLKAADFAESERRSPWDFAVELDDLRRLGLSRSDLRWLICRGWLEHAAELSSSGSAERVFRPTGRLTFRKNSCFILTSTGRATAFHLISTSLSPATTTSSPGVETREEPPHASFEASERAAQSAANQQPAYGDQPTASGNGAPPQQNTLLKPCWDPDLNRLTLGDLVVKEYRTPAPNQQLILSAFQEENWPPRIDDPLPPHPDQDPKRRLHETVVSLNRNQRNPVLKFSGDGSGLGVRWITSSQVVGE